MNVANYPPPNTRAKINVATRGTANPDQNGIYVRGFDNNSDAIMTVRVPNGSTANPAVSFDHDGIKRYQMGISTGR